MARILILIGGHLCTAPRPQKEAAALAAAGHQVTVAGGWFDNEFAGWDRSFAASANFQFATFADIRPRGLHRIQRAAKQIRRRLAQRRFERTGDVSAELFGLFAREALRFAPAFPADLTIVHSESGLFAAPTLRRLGRRVGADFEDWFSEDILPQDRPHRPVRELKSLENDTLRSSRYILTTSHVMANEFARVGGGNVPAVVYNTFPSAAIDAKRRDRTVDLAAEQPVSLHWFSQTIGPGRGLEVLCAALPIIRGTCEVHLRGRISAAHRTWLESEIPPSWRGRVRLHPPVSNAELPSRIAEHDIGFALEESARLSHDLTVSNKFFQYLQGGLAVIATDTRGQREAAASAAKAVTIVPQRNPEAVAAAINTLLSNRERLAAAKAAAVLAHHTTFGWEKQAAQIVARAQAALA